MGLVVGYSRVSTLEQAHHRSLEDQVFRLKAAGANIVYADVASRTKDDRSGLLEIVRLVEAGEVSAVMVTRLDRITSSPGLFEKIGEIFQRQLVRLVALDEQVDIHSVEGEFVAGLQVHFARREVKTIRLRSLKAQEVRRMKGRAPSSLPWGYANVDGKYELDHTPFLCLLSDRPDLCAEDNRDRVKADFPGRTKAQMARDIVDIFFEVGSFSGATKFIHTKYGIQKFQKPPISKSKHYVFEDEFDYKEPVNKRAGIFRWSKDGIRNYLLSPVLQGHTPYKTMKTIGERKYRRAPQQAWDIRCNTHLEQALITEAEALKIQEKVAFNREFRGWRNFAKGGNIHPLTGLIICAHCGRTMRTKASKYKDQVTTYYQCKNYAEGACNVKTMVRMDAVEQAVIAALITRNQEISVLAATTVDHDTPFELKELRAQLLGLEQLGQNPAIAAAIDQVKKQIENFQVKMTCSSKVEQGSRDLLMRVFSDHSYWTTLSDNDKREIYRALVEKVVVRDGVVQEVRLKV